jgi:hypothetical protein
LQHPITPCNCTSQLELTTGIFDDGRWKIETFHGKKSPLFRENQRDNERKWLAMAKELEWYKLIQKPKDNMQL